MGIADGKRALVIGLANDKSLAWPIVQNLKAQGAEIALTYQGEVLERRVRPLAEQVGATVLGELDVGNDAQIEATFAKVRELWGGLDMLVHAIAFAEREDLRDRFLTVSRANFARSLEISAYSLVALARAAEPLMEARGGGAIVTLTYLGAVRAIPNYNVMGVAKAALEACVRYLALDLGSQEYPGQCDQRGAGAHPVFGGDQGVSRHGARSGAALAAAAPDGDRRGRQDGRGAAERHVQRRHRANRVR